MDAWKDQIGVVSKPALLCLSVAQDKETLATSLTELDYRVELAMTVDDALDKMTTTEYEIIVLDDVFDGSTLENNMLLNVLQEMLMATRRSIFVALLGSQFTTGDYMMAYAKSVNVVIHPNDMGDISTILKHSIAENREFFRTITECFHEVGMGT